MAQDLTGLDGRGSGRWGRALAFGARARQSRYSGARTGSLFFLRPLRRSVMKRSRRKSGTVALASRSWRYAIGYEKKGSSKGHVKRADFPSRVSLLISKPTQPAPFSSTSVSCVINDE